MSEDRDKSSGNRKEDELSVDIKEPSFIVGYGFQLTDEDTNFEEMTFSSSDTETERKEWESEDGIVLSGGAGSDIIFGGRDLETPNESTYSTELDEIFTQLHNTDKHIEETRQNTVRLGIETRSMLDDLRKQLG